MKHMRPWNGWWTATIAVAVLVLADSAAGGGLLRFIVGALIVCGLNEKARKVSARRRRLADLVKDYAVATACLELYGEVPERIRATYERSVEPDLIRRRDATKLGVNEVKALRRPPHR